MASAGALSPFKEYADDTTPIQRKVGDGFVTTCLHAEHRRSLFRIGPDTRRPQLLHVQNFRCISQQVLLSRRSAIFKSPASLLFPRISVPNRREIWLSLWENEELAIGQHHTGSAAAVTFGRAGLSSWLTFGLVKLPA